MRISDEEMRAGHEFALRAEQHGFDQVDVPGALPAEFAEVLKSGHADAFRLTFVLMGAIALVGGAVVPAGAPRRPGAALAGVQPPLALDLGRCRARARGSRASRRV